MKLKIIAVGGTIDKVYFDAKSAYQVGEPTVRDILSRSNVTFEYECESLLKKDSLDMTDEDRQLVCERVRSVPEERVLITHGTDTMVETAQALRAAVPGKTIVLTGAMEPARFHTSDAVFNLGGAVAAAQVLPAGVYIVMNGRVFGAGRVQKNVEMNRFEETQ